MMKMIVSKGKEKISVNDKRDTLIPPKKIKKRNRSNDGEDDAQSSKKKSKKVPWKRKILKLTDFEVWDLFLGPFDHYKCQLSVHTNCGIVTALKSKLDKKQLDLFKNSYFGYFLSLPSVFPQNQLIHGMLLRELVCERDDEIWIKCWFYEYCPYADGHLADRVGDGVPRILNCKQECSQSSSDNELTFFRSDVKMVGKSIGDNDGDNSSEKDDETPNVGGTGDDQVNDSPNVGQQNDVVPKVDHISDNLMDDVGKATDCVGGDIIGHLVDDVGEKVNFVGDCVGGHVAVDSAAETFKDCAWTNFSNFNFLKFTQSSSENKDIGEVEIVRIPDAEISKFTQPDKSVATTDATNLVYNNVRKVDANESENVKGIEKNMLAASIMLDKTPAIPRRLRKPAAVSESPFLSKFDSDCGKVEGQSSKSVENAQPSKSVLSIKHPFVKSIAEQIDDMKVTLQFNRFVARSLRVKQMPVYSDSVNTLLKYFDYGVDTIKMKEWYFTLAYPGVPLTDSMMYYVCGDCGVFVAAFTEYLLDGLEIFNYLDDIDAILVQYGVLLWDYGKKKQR
ncbi:hypothetical protein FXO38_34521 [Capsicum annuum]|nr:hypothetical protein FXO38_34521 [Capsicum annuum]